ncbi:hypothetical protein KPH14_006907 [Odynerus spinipes]|uniref:SWI/SNF-related matrix-associated actin-dependent regulator of chromatin subfamily A-like protein 1 n=1 Tax=Odynerus spinipes TaxID=1348599 RepID=A0AAD9VRP6_9HYME|nr:hypothetical protein KPH14_006907 [Odynerus spinipes]
MATVEYTQKEIEAKRLLALQKRKQVIPKVQVPFDPGKIQSNVNKQTHVTNFAQNVRNLPSITKNPKFISPKRRNFNKNEGGPMRSHKKDNRYKPMEAQKFFGINSIVTAKCYMITNERFAVEMSSYVPAVIELFKTINSKIYDINTKIWNFHLKDYDNLMGKLLKSNICLIQIPRSLLQIFQKNLNTSNEIPFIDLSPIDPTLRNMLMPFQQEGICYGISKNGRCIIADDMGLGKTIQALGIAHYFKDDWPLLIVAPSSVRYQWSEAIYSFLPSVPAHYVYQFTNAKDCISDVKIVIVSYDLLVRAEQVFKQHGFGFVILDESHTLKSNKTARFKAVQNTVSHARRIILLSGTPALSRPIELYTQINLVSPNFMKFQEYGIRYCAGEKKSFGWDFTGSSNMQELQLLLKSTCIIRRLKSDVLSQLPEKIRQMIILDPVLIKAGTKEMEEMSSKLQRKTLSGVERHNALLQYYNESSFARLKAVCNHVTHLFEKKRKCLIFAHHQHVLDEICNIAVSMNIKYIRIDGRTSSDQRKCLVNKFQEEDNCLVAVLSITAANAGITLTAARLVVFAELFWNPGVLCQAEDRVHRIGQDCSVLIQYLVAKQTVDDYLWPLIQRKTNVLSEVGLNQNIPLNEVKVTKQLTDNNQLKIDSFMEQSQRMSLESTSEINKNDEKEHNTLQNNKEGKKEQIITENLEELLNLDEEDLQNCDWDDFL